MSEQLNEDPWTDEVCQDWLDHEIEVSRRFGYNTAELNQVINDTMRDAVRGYVHRSAIEQFTSTLGGGRLTLFLANRLLADAEVIDVDISPAD
jgi:hypothetical protein